MSRKSQETFRFKYHCNYDVSEIKAEIMKLEAEWLTDTSRQDSFDVHKETVTFFLTDFPLLWEAGQVFQPYLGSIAIRPGGSRFIGAKDHGHPIIANCLSCMDCSQ